ncbi:cryptochrome/photolyase family protein [Flavobacterium aciduliphilum]|uniref:Deoxyribodipyrimidine photolyase-related protein n=1 Tax=Flavobacterium aciduliphilum TaxID=1101402 RepID=A0A328YKU6_9FLAO|nr:cryptochrome/photolyase family protein [Flavobacterium aciduliphilum]RAR74160.1 deoxyribodipyrimidine photolyase-related protein [Flavobacterium aciduliphilum]
MIVRLILGDQLNSEHSWFREEAQANYLYVLMEMRSETNYVTHHHQKVIAFFAAMRHFSEELKAKGCNVFYFKIDDPFNQHSFEKNLQFLHTQYKIAAFHYQWPDEYRLYQEFKRFKSVFHFEVKAFDSEHYYCSLQEIALMGAEKKQYLLENFYRHLRKKHQILVVNDKPIGGKWNFDTDNRNKWKNQVHIPKALRFENDASEITQNLKNAGISTFGKINTISEYPKSRAQALEQLSYFLEHVLRHFGTYQDAMHTEEKLLFHSNLSFALNVKMLSPKEVVQATEHYYNQHQDTIDLAQVEGFIRQILGWREYVRMVYWNTYSELKTSNFLEHTKPLPNVFWTGKSKMLCVATCAQNSLDHSYAHHIQRLMVLGNYALLMETHPDAVDAWYLGVYVDAVEWVQLPNTRGMSQFADGGIVATKPYVSSSNYIDKMSNYCTACDYDKKTKTEENSCPFNSLYWHFLDKNQDKFQNNPRMKMMYALLHKMNQTELEKINQKARNLIETRTC